MITAMLRPDLFGALATHSGDSLYELCYIPMFAKGARALRQYDHDIMNWWEDFCSRPPFSKDADITLLLVLGVSACFSAAEDGTPELPFERGVRCVAPRAMAAVAGLGPRTHGASL